MPTVTEKSKKQKAISKTCPTGERWTQTGCKAQAVYFSVKKLMREVEDAILRLYQQGKIVGGPCFPEMETKQRQIGSAFPLEKNDYLFPMHHDMGAHFVKGQSVLNLMLQHIGPRVQV